jgi:hypothetical protein
VISVTSTLFDDVQQTDGTPMQYAESRYEFLNRSATEYLRRARDVMEDWLSHVPAIHRQDLCQRLKAPGHTHEAAFWELYLYEGYLRAGWSVTIHPDVGGSNHPDFLIEGPATSFYLEAVSVGVARLQSSQDRRLEDVYEVLSWRRRS